VRTHELGETVDSRWSWVVVQGGRFWHLKSRVNGLAREAQNRETGSIESEGGSQGGSGGFWAGSWDSVFSSKFTSSHFLLNVTFLCKLRRINVDVA